MVAQKSKPKMPDNGSGLSKTRTEATRLVSQTAYIRQGKAKDSIKVLLPSAAANVLKSDPKRIRALLQQYGNAIEKSHNSGQSVSFRVDVNATGETVLTEVKNTSLPIATDTDVTDPELAKALVAARERGKIKAGEILTGRDMLSADDFAKLLGTTRETVNAKRKRGLVLGLEGAKRGFRFPEWQIDPDGKPYAAIETLQNQLGGAWAAYLFLVQVHGELDGLTGREALERGKTKQVMEVLSSMGGDFR
jgi:hypothetical protein